MKYIIEIKNRIFITVFSWLNLLLINYKYKNTLLYLYIKPSYSTITNDKNIYFIYTNISELFSTYIDVIILTTVPIYISIFTYQVIIFLKPGLYQSEFKLITTYLKIFFTVILLVFNLFYFFVIPLSFNFFFFFQKSINDSQPINFFFEAKLNEYINYISYLILFCILISITISIILYTIVLNSKSVKNYIKKNRKRIYFIFWLLITLITPPEVISQLISGSIMILIFEIYIYLMIFKVNLYKKN